MKREVAVMMGRQVWMALAIASLGLSVSACTTNGEDVPDGAVLPPAPEDAALANDGSDMVDGGGGQPRACVGAAQTACGNCGTRTRTCEASTWSEWSSCVGEGACVPNATEACGDGGTRTCEGACQWGPCAPPTACSGPSAQACGNCGTQTRTCNAGVWSGWSSCTGEGVCALGSSQACGTGGMQTCAAACQWGPCSNPACAGPTTQTCGKCGTQTRTCSGGTWSAWSTCSGESGACRPNDLQACTGGAQLCDGSCQWGSCKAGVTCVLRSYSSPDSIACNESTWVDHPDLWFSPGGPDPEAILTTDESYTLSRVWRTPVSYAANATHDVYTGPYASFGTALREGLFITSLSVDYTRVGNDTRACPYEIAARCEGGTCIGSSHQTCGVCRGTRKRSCTASGWSAWESCVGGDPICAANAVEACGNGGTRQCSSDGCGWSACTNQVCSGSVTQSCGACMEQTRTCSGGTWSSWSTCDAKLCAPGHISVGGSGFACAVRTDGTLACWGKNDKGQATPPAGTFSSVSAGAYHACALKTDGTLACWGDNSHGEATVSAGTFLQVDAGIYNTCALRTDGALACWGDNSGGQSSPPAGTGFVQVSTGGSSCAVAANGKVTCWGPLNPGSIAPPSGTYAPTFLQVEVGGRGQTCGVKTDHTVVCWGDNGEGQSNAPSGTFLDVSAGGSTPSGGGSLSCGVRMTNGSLACWGYQTVAPPTGTFREVSTGSGVGCAIRTDGTLFCWGGNTSSMGTPPSGTF